jgi:CubicO group peptidase (beta-lactamase class C family)
MLEALGLGLGLLLASAGPAVPGAAWEQAPAPEAAGWSAAGLEAADRFARTLDTDAYLVVARGRIVHQYGDCARPINIHSMRKSILSILVGIHADRGQVPLAATLADLGIDDKAGLTAAERKATVRQLLQARSGIYVPAAYETREMAQERPARGSFPPGAHWYYNNWDFNALGSVFRRCAGQDVFQALQADLAGPLGFQDFDRARDTRFWYEPCSDHPAYLMDLSARDLARVGLLMARGGRWGDRQIVSGAWVAESTRAWSDAGHGRGYGYLWWIHGAHGTFAAHGHLGQTVIVNPGKDLVFVHLVDGGPKGRRRVTGPQLDRLLDLVTAASPAPRPAPTATAP